MDSNNRMSRNGAILKVNQFPDKNLGSFKNTAVNFQRTT